jgi:hypothetical protein
MSRSLSATKWHSVRRSLAPQRSRFRFGLETVIFVLAVGFTVAVVCGLIGG